MSPTILTKIIKTFTNNLVEKKVGHKFLEICDSNKMSSKDHSLLLC